MRLDHLLSKESGKATKLVLEALVQGKERASIVFNFEGPVKRNLKESKRNRHGKPWGYSSAGRAPALQAGGQGFDSLYLHHYGLIAQVVRAHA